MLNFIQIIVAIIAITVLIAILRYLVSGITPDRTEDVESGDAEQLCRRIFIDEVCVQEQDNVNLEDSVNAIRQGKSIFYI